MGYLHDSYDSVLTSKLIWLKGWLSCSIARPSTFVLELDELESDYYGGKITDNYHAHPKVGYLAGGILSSLYIACWVTVLSLFFHPHFELIPAFQPESQFLSMASQDFEKQVNNSTDPIAQAPSLHNDEDMHKLPDGMHADIGLELYREALLMDPAEREAIARRVKMKLDCILMPMV